jgi:hypothetical protein
MAFSVLDLTSDRTALEAAQDEHSRRVAEAGPLAPLLPDGARPPVDPDTAPAYVRDHLLRAAMKSP